MDRDALEFVETAMGIKGQVPKTSYRINKPGDMKDIATALWKKEGVVLDSRSFAAGRKLLAELATKLGLNLNSFGAAKALTKDEMEQYELGLTSVINAVRDGDLTVKSRGILTSLMGGRNPCSFFFGERSDNGVQEGHFPPHTPGAGFGITPSAHQEGSYFQLQRLASLRTATIRPPLVVRAKPKASSTTSAWLTP
jgi:hypothetical protein